MSLSFIRGLVAAVNPCGFILLPTYLMYFLGISAGGTGTQRATIRRALLVSAEHLAHAVHFRSYPSQPYTYLSKCLAFVLGTGFDDVSKKAELQVVSKMRMHCRMVSRESCSN